MSDSRWRKELASGNPPEPSADVASERDALRKFRTLLDYAPEAIVLLDIETGRFSDANSRAEEMFGLSRSELQGIGPLELSPTLQPDGPSAALFRKHILEAIEGGVPGFEWWLYNARRERFPCEVCLVKMPWGDRDVIRGSITDISMRKQMQLCDRGRSEVLEKVACGAPLSEVLQALVRTMEEILPNMISSVLLLDSDTNTLRLGAAPSLPDFYNAAVDGLSIGPRVGSCGAAASTGQRVVVSDVTTHPNWAGFRALADQADVRACWSQPILSLDSSVLGTFALYYREPREPVSVEVQIIELAAHLAAVAIERDRHRQGLRELNDTLDRRVTEKTAELSRANSELRAAEAELRLAAVSFHARDSIMITDANGRILRVNDSFTELTGYESHEVIGRNPRILKSGHHDRAFYGGMWSALAEHGSWAGEVWNRRKDGSVYLQRLTIAGVKNDSGEVSHYVSTAHDLTQERRAVADRAAIELARLVQEGLLQPAAPRVPGFDIAGAVRPAEQVSGDYFDYLSLGKDSVGVLVADVTGHGLGPALLMAQTQAYLRALAETRADPGEILTCANRFMSFDKTGHFVTLFLASIDPRTRSLVYAGAGHDAYLLDSDGNERILEATGIALGIQESAIIACSPPMQLGPGDVLILTTDGIEETAAPDTSLFGSGRVFDLVRAKRDEPARDILEALFRAAFAYSRDVSQLDDRTCVVIKVDDVSRLPSC